MELTARDLAVFAGLRIPTELLVTARIQRVTDREARDLLAINGMSGDMAGVFIPYLSPKTGRRTGGRVRRDHPEIEDGKPKNKYIAGYGDRRHLYVVPGSESLLEDLTVPVILVEAEKSALALTAWGARTGTKIFAMGMGGCWGWTGKIGKLVAADGTNVDEKGPLPELSVCGNGRPVYVLLDSNCATNPKVQIARAALKRQLVKQKADVRILDLPAGDGVNGPDDFIAAHGDEALAALLQQQSSDWRALFHSYEETVNAPPLKFAIQGFLQQDAITLIGALAGHGKTMVMLNMVKVLIEGGKLFNYYPFEVKERSKRVIYCIPECGLAPFVHRLKLFRLMDHVRDQKLFFRTLNAKAPLTSLADPRMLKAAEGADVFLDTAIRFMEGDENSASDQRAFAQTLFNLQEAGARTIVGAHHSPKNLGHANFLTLENVLRGSGDLGAMIATCWGVFQQDSKTNKLVLKNVKPRDFDPCSEFSIQGRPYLEEQGFFQIMDMPGELGEFNPQQERGKKGGRPPIEGKDEKLAEARRLMGAGKTAEEAADAVDVSRATLFRWMGSQ